MLSEVNFYISRNLPAVKTTQNLRPLKISSVSESPTPLSKMTSILYLLLCNLNCLMFIGLELFCNGRYVVTHKNTNMKENKITPIHFDIHNMRMLAINFESKLL